jgi:hypothetical protein
MSFLLMTGNVIVVSIYLASTLAVVLHLWSALVDLGKLIAKLDRVGEAIAKAFRKVLGNPAARMVAHGWLFAMCLYLVAAGIIFAPNAPVAGVLLAVLGHVCAAGLVVANQKAR